MTPHAPPDDLTRDELLQRILYALLRPTAKLASAFDLPLKELTQLIELAYFRELRAQGLTLPETGQALAISTRKAGRLSRLLREKFLDAEREHTLPRRIEFMLWSQPMSQARLNQVLPDVSEDALGEALETLLREGRITPVQGRVTEYKPALSLRKLPRDTWMRRLGGLMSFADNLADATWGRFFRATPGTQARTVSFSIPAGSERELAEWYEAVVLPKIVAMDAEADTLPPDQRRPMRLSICWAPYEHLDSERAEQRADTQTPRDDADS